MNHSSLSVGQGLVVLAHTTVATKPRKGALDHPAARQNGELRPRRRIDTGRTPGAGTGTPDHLNGEPELGRGPGRKRAGIALVNPEMREAGMPSGHACQQGTGTVTIGNVGGMDVNGEHQTQGIDQQVPLPAAQLLGAVVPPRPPFSVVFTD